MHVSWVWVMLWSVETTPLYYKSLQIHPCRNEDYVAFTTIIVEHLKGGYTSTQGDLMSALHHASQYIFTRNTEGNAEE